MPIIKNIQSVPGFAYGYRSPSLFVDISLMSMPAAISPRLSHALRDVVAPQLAEMSRLGTDSYPASLADQLVWWLWAVQKCVRIPAVEPGRSVVLSGALFVRLVIPAPVNCHELIEEILRYLVSGISNEDEGTTRESIHQALAGFIERLRKFSLSGSNVPHFLAAAAALDIPVAELVGRILRFGQGRKMRWLDSSFTDRTPYLAAVISRNKRLTSRVLHAAGIPVAPNALVDSHQQALAIAEKLGFPVVIKPANRDRGIGVACGLMAPAEVITAFDEARQHSQEILIEKHMAGRDYRLNVLNGEILWAIERVPAGVLGDGEHTVTELLERLNADPRRGNGRDYPLQKILLDDEALGLLTMQRMTAESVPGLGDYVPLRWRANVSAGGTPIAVMDRVHPDNARLAVRAAAAVGLDIAGVDLLMADISQSWMDIGGVVCEVNGQPQLGSVTSAHVYKEVLQKLMDGDGRIPITLVVGGTNSIIASQVVDRYRALGLCVGLSGKQGVFVGNECISKNPVVSYRAGQILQADRRVEAMVLEIRDSAMLRYGFPFDGCDQLLAGENMSDEENILMAHLSSMANIRKRAHH